MDVQLAWLHFVTAGLEFRLGLLQIVFAQQAPACFVWQLHQAGEGQFVLCQLHALSRKEALRASADSLLFQETTMSRRGKQQILRFLPGCRGKVLWGSGPINDSSTGGCCALPLHTPAVEVEHLGALQCFASDGRFQHVIMNFYCKVGDCGYNEKLLWALLQHLARLGPVPVLLGGDFQSDVINSSVFQLLYQHGWYNLARL